MSVSSIIKPSATALLALAFLLGACQMNVGTVELHLVKTNAGPDPLDPKDIKTLRVCIEGDDMDAQRTEVSLQSDGQVLTDVPLGKNRVLTVEGLDHPGYIQSRGVSTPFRIKSGKTKVYLYISQVEKFSAPPSVSLDEYWRDHYMTKMVSPRIFHTSTLLPDGTVLVAGGAAAPRPDDYMGRVASADPTAMRFQITPCAFLKENIDCESGRLCMNKENGRAHHTADLLRGGTHVVVAGGEPVNPNVYEWPAEYYSAETRSFEGNIEMRHVRTRHASAVLTGSKEGVLVAGGEGAVAWDVLDSVELFEAGIFKDLSDLALHEKRTGAVAVSFPDCVLVTGGWRAADQTSKVVDVLRFDQDPPSADWFEMNHERAGHTAVVTQEGKVFVCGGISYEHGVPEMVESCEMLDPEAQTTTEYQYPGFRRWEHTATLLDDGRMLVAGGFSSVPPSLTENSAVLFDTPLGNSSRQTVPMISNRARHTATLLSNGMVVLIGGVSGVGSSIDIPSQDYEIFNPRPR